MKYPIVTSNNTDKWLNNMKFSKTVSCLLHHRGSRQKERGCSRVKEKERDRVCGQMRGRGGGGQDRGSERESKRKRERVRGRGGGDENCDLNTPMLSIKVSRHISTQK